MSIMEKNLPIAESLGEGDKLRIVTSEGNSKQIDASEIGGDSGGSIILKVYYDDDYETYFPSFTYTEFMDAITSGKLVYIANSFGTLYHQVVAYDELVPNQNIYNFVSIHYETSPSTIWRLLLIKINLDHDTEGILLSMGSKDIL